MALVAGTVIAVDQVTKSLVESRLSDGHVVHLVGSLRFALARNSGAAFSIGRDDNLGPVIALLAVVVVAVLVATGSTARSRLGAVAVGLIAGGALGNIVDRAFRSGSGFLGGHVVDFIDLQWWPTFNIADAGVSVGAVLLIAFVFRSGSPGEPVD